MYLVTVIFVITPDKAAAFHAHVATQANDSLQEPGCQRFDIWQDPADPARVFLYEVYDDRAAFDAHLVSAHFKAFDAEVASWVMDKQVETGVISKA